MILWTLGEHPEIYAGINDAAFGMDDIGGGGVNDEIWPDFFDSAQVPIVRVTSAAEEAQDIPDFRVKSERLGFKVRVERQAFRVRN